MSKYDSFKGKWKIQKMCADYIKQKGGSCSFSELLTYLSQNGYMIAYFTRYPHLLNVDVDEEGQVWVIGKGRKADS